MEKIKIGSYNWQKITSRKEFIGKIIGNYSAYYAKNRASITVTVVEEDDTYGSINGAWNFNCKVDNPKDITKGELKKIMNLCKEKVKKLSSE